MKTFLATTAIAGLLTVPAFAQGADSTMPAPGGQPLAVHDLNADGVIDELDLQLADTNADGVVDANDEPQLAQGDSLTAPLPAEDGQTAESVVPGVDDPAAADSDTDVAVGDTVDPMAPVPGADATGDATDLAEGADPMVPADGGELAQGTDPMAPPADGTDTAQVTPAVPGDAAGAAAEAEMADAQAITGERVYDANDDWIGEVSEIVTAEGRTWAIIDVGGFLGIGEKPVALELTDLDIATDPESNDLKVSVGMTKEELEALPTYERG